VCKKGLGIKEDKMRVKDFMKTDLVTVDIKTSVLEAQEIMRKKRIKRLPVMKKDKLVGMVTKHMLLEASPSPATSLSVYELNYLIAKMTVGDIMVRDPISIPSDLPVEEAIWLGTERGIGGFPVVDNGRLVGIITESDMTRVLSEVLGVRGEGQRITIDGMGERLGELRELISVLDEHKTPLLSLITIPRKERKDWVVIVRVRSSDVQEVARALKDKGFSVTDVS
jgi:acetoin utilization protein AcuB